MRPDLRMALPKGRMQEGVRRLLADAGIDVRWPARGYRAGLGIPGFDDQDIPRVIGLLGTSLLVVNHLSGASPSEAQARTELGGPRVQVLRHVVEDLRTQVAGAAAPGAGASRGFDRVAHVLAVALADLAEQRAVRTDDRS